MGYEAEWEVWKAYQGARTGMVQSLWLVKTLFYFRLKIKYLFYYETKTTYNEHKWKLWFASESKCNFLFEKFFENKT